MSFDDFETQQTHDFRRREVYVVDVTWLKREATWSYLRKIFRYDESSFEISHLQIHWGHHR